MLAARRSGAGDHRARAMCAKALNKMEPGSSPKGYHYPNQERADQWRLEHAGHLKSESTKSNVSKAVRGTAELASG